MYKLRAKDTQMGRKDTYHLRPLLKQLSKGCFFKEKFNRGGTKVGWARAKQLKERRPITDAEIKRITSYFARHEVDKKAKNFGNEANPSKGYIARLLWGETKVESGQKR